MSDNDSGVQTDDTQSSGGGFWSQLARWSEKSGPGWLLSAYTLGSGTAVGSLWAGAAFGYDLLWVQPISMLMGVVVLSGAAYVALRNEKAPYKLFWELSPALAVSWGLCSLFASIIWHFPQYGLAYEALQELLGFPETAVTQTVVALAILAFATWLCWSYASGSQGMALFETIIKVVVWLMVLCFAVVVVVADVDWGAVLRGFFTFHRPANATPVMFGMLGAAVGINMTFLYPYSVRSKGWGAGDVGVPVRDLWRGMFVPYLFITALLIIASAATLHASGVHLEKSDIARMAGIFEPVFGNRWGPLLLYLGVFAMPVSSIVLHMLTSGFIVSEMMGKPLYGPEWKVGSLLPAVGAFGVAVSIKGWLPIAASAICFIFLPVAYIGFAILFIRQVRSESGDLAERWNRLVAPIVAVIIVISALAVNKLVGSVQKLAAIFFGG